MAAQDWILGDASAVGFTMNAVATNDSWSGAAQTLRYQKPMKGQSSITIGSEWTPLESLDVDPVAFSKGGRQCKGSFTVPLSYIYHEGLIRLALGTASYTPGIVNPYTHALTLAQRVLYGNLVYYWENYKGVRYQIAVTNAMVTQFTISQSAQARPTIAISWVGQTPTDSTPGADPTLVAMEYPDWDEFTLTINSIDHVVSDFTFDVTNPAKEGDYQMASAETPDVVFLGRSGQRSITLNVTGGIDDVIDTFMRGGTKLTTCTAVWDNGGATTSQRVFNIALGTLLPVVSEQPRGEFSKLEGSRQFLCQTSVANPISITTTNSLVAAEPPAP
jgi:hypothetical protein